MKTVADAKFEAAMMGCRHLSSSESYSTRLYVSAITVMWVEIKRVCETRVRGRSSQFVSFKVLAYKGGEECVSYERCQNAYRATSVD